MKNFFLTAIFSVVICHSLHAQPKKRPAAPKKDVVASNVNKNVSPAKDFFEFANGGWIKANPIPAEQSSWGIGNLVIEENTSRLRKICEVAASKKRERGTPDQLIGDFWITAMDTVLIEKQGLSNLAPLLQKIENINDSRGLLETVAMLKTIGSSTLFSDYVGQDAKNSDVMMYQLFQGGLGLPEREYYFKNDSSTITIRKAYKKYISLMLSMSGDNADNASKAAEQILSLETIMARASRKIEALRDPYNNYNKLSLEEWQQQTPNINWSAYITNLTGKKIDSVIVGQPEFFTTLNTLLDSIPMDDFKAYVKFNLISDMAALLPDRFGQASFEFNRLFSGAKVRKPRWKRMIQLQEGAMGELMGQLYVKEFFDERAKQRYELMVTNIKEALKVRIDKLEWMSPETKQKAQIKLASIKSKVGYPDKWKDFSSMSIISSASLLENYMQSRKWWHEYEFNKLGKPINRDEWEMTPQTYNAYYNPSNNEIVLPAGIFTIPGYRDEEVDDAVVYGYGGASTIGHEITHGFDDEGRQFDEKGNLQSWWTPEDEEAFIKRADVMVKQFDAYEPVKGYHINGRATLGENIADLGGILLGIEAFKKTKQYKEGKPIAGFTPMQRYFMGYALGWLGHTREEQEKNRLLTDVHSPAKYRVNGPFVDVDEFYGTFNVKPGTPMFLPASLRVRIW